jgi:hypothetical protein
LPPAGSSVKLSKIQKPGTCRVFGFLPYSLWAETILLKRSDHANMPPKTKKQNSVIESDALKANLQETAVEDVPIDPSYAVLVDIVADFRGIHNSINDLLFEITGALSCPNSGPLS